MGLLDSSLFVDNTDWTEVTTNGSLTWNQDDGDGRIYLRQAGGTFNNIGVYRTTGTVAVAGQVVYIDVRVGTLGSGGMIYMLDDAAGLNTQEGFGPYNESSGPWRRQDDGGVAGNKGTFDNETWYNVRYVLDVGGNITITYHEDDGTDQQDVTSWTALWTSSNFTWTGKTLIWETLSNAQTVDWSRWRYTDDGTYPVASPPSGGGKTKMGDFIQMGCAGYEKENGIYKPRHERIALAA